MCFRVCLRPVRIELFGDDNHMRSHYLPQVRFFISDIVIVDVVFCRLFIIVLGDIGSIR